MGSILGLIWGVNIGVIQVLELDRKFFLDQMATSKMEGHLINFSQIGSPSAIRSPSTPQGMFSSGNR